MKKIVLGVILLIAIVTSVANAGGRRDAQVASYNLSHAADHFEITRRIIFYNSILDVYMLEIVGRCSLSVSETLRVTCKIGPGEFVKHYLGTSDNVTWFAEQVETKDVSVFHHKITFKPQSIVPSVEIRVNAQELKEVIPTVKRE